MSGTTTARPDYDAIKTRQRAMWGSGDYSSIATIIYFMSERMIEDMDIRAGQTVLDVATGSGNAALAAARRGARVTGTDYVQSLLDRAEQRATVENLQVTWQIADAENLPFDDDTFDAVTSVVGVMFAPNQSKAASEMVRVCKPGGKIVVANWTPEGFVGAMLKTVGKYVSPPPGLSPPVRWGTEEGMEELMGERCELQMTRHNQVFRFETPADFANLFIDTYGPTERAHASLDDVGKKSFRDALMELADTWNTAKDGSIRIPSGYLETTATRR